MLPSNAVKTLSINNKDVTPDTDDIDFQLIIIDLNNQTKKKKLSNLRPKIFFYKSKI